MNGNEKMETGASGAGTMRGFDTPDFEESFNRHYVRTDGRNRITHGFSDAFEQPVEADIPINEKGGRHFRLILDGAPTHENPWELMLDEGGVPLLMWDGKEIKRRAENEIRADLDAIPAPEPAAPLEERLGYLEKTVGYHEKVIDALLDTVPKAQKAQIAQFQKAMLGAFNG